MPTESDRTPTDQPRLTVVSEPLKVNPVPDQQSLVPSTMPPYLKEHSDYLWNTHKYKNDYIRFADTKAAFTITFCSALMAALYKNDLHKLFVASAPKDWGGAAWMALASLLSLVVSIGAGVWTIRPRLASPQPKGLIYWGAIAEHGTPEAFWASIKGSAPEQLNEHLAHHVFRLAAVAKQKYFWVSFSMTAGVIGGGIAAVVILFR